MLAKESVGFSPRKDGRIPWRFILASFCACAAAVLALAAPAQAGQKLSNASTWMLRSAVQSGGVRSIGGTTVLQQSVGQAGTVFSAGGPRKAEPGFMPLAAQPGSVVAITTVTKATGSMELAWNAPGLDGSFAGVVNGYYRIDTSSDPLHVFSPTRFETEFATSVVPGDPQSFVLTGLEANTTYYTRIYLADTRKFFAEDSRRGDESTLARVPVSPSLAGVFSSSVTFTWTLPADGAEGFRIDGSSTDFGALYPGGIVKTSQTPSGLAVTLTVVGLNSRTTYYFKLASLNWQSEPNFTTIIATCTLPAGPQPIIDLVLTGDRMGRKVLLTWTNPYFDYPAGVLVQASTNPISSDVVDTTAYGQGFEFADGSVVKATAAATSYLETDLELDSTRYFRLHSKNTAHQYSVAVSTYIVLDLPPMAPPGMWSETTADRSSVTLHWEPVVTNLDGSFFRLSSAPITWELDRYSVYRATSIARAGWSYVGSVGASASSFTASIPVPGDVYFYKVVSKDGFGDEADEAMVLDTVGNLYALSEDKITRLKLPPSLAYNLRSMGNSYNKPMVLRAQERPQDLGGKVVKSVRFDPMMPSAEKVRMTFSDPDAHVVMHYETSAGRVVAAGMGAQEEVKLDPQVTAMAASGNLGAYWDNGKDFVKLYGDVDSGEQLVSVQSGMTGAYQIRTLLRSEGFTFDISSRSNKYLTPNGDGLNDTVVFVFDNPRDSGISGRIFASDGSQVADMKAGPLANTLQWDGKAFGRAVAGGVYLYQIRAEDKVFNGSLVVVR